MARRARWLTASTSSEKGAWPSAYLSVQNVIDKSSLQPLENSQNKLLFFGDFLRRPCSSMSRMSLLLLIGVLLLSLSCSPQFSSATVNTVSRQLLEQQKQQSWWQSKQRISTEPDRTSSVIFPLAGNVYPDGIYYAALNIGNPPKPYFLDVDTGSDLTWVQCDAPCVNCAKGMALERRHLPEVDRKEFHQHSGYIDIDKISTDAWPAIVADLSSGESGIISLAFGYTRLFQPQKPVTNAQAAIALSTGDLAEVVGEELTRIEAESLAETAVAAHTALVTEVEKELNASFEKELSIEREKNVVIEKLAEEATSELKNLRLERDEEYNSLIRGRAAVESEMEVLSRLRNELEEQLHNVISKKTEITFERDRINNLRMEAENENQTITQLQHELEIERKALSMARAWAEDEAKKAREQGKALEEARERWERHGIKVIVDDELREPSSAIVTFVNAGKQNQVEEATDKSKENILVKFKSRSQNIFEELKVRAEKLVEKLKTLALQVKGKSSDVIQRIIQKIVAIISTLKQQFSEASQTVTEKQTALISKAIQSMQDLKDKSTVFSSDVKDGAKKTVEDFKETLEKITKSSKTS